VVAISTLLLVVAVSLVITRVATVILTATGMSRESARFQARSAFTGSGFTTRESEKVVDHPLRRKVIMTLMLLGNAGIVAAVSSTILGFNPNDVGHNWWRVLELVLGLMLLVTVSRSRWVDRRVTRAISGLLGRYTRLQTRDIDGLLDLSGDYSVSELMVNEGDWIAGHALGELALRDEGVVVLGLTRQDGRYLAAPTGRTVVTAGDVLVVYGRSELLNELDDRPAGRVGDVAHEAAVLRQERIERQQDMADAAPYPASPEGVRVER
jgi:K+/H+ antiporter YhaU regulatory subunit KhtT